MSVRWLAVLALAVLVGSSAAASSSSSELEHQLTQIFSERSFTIRNFYQGAKLQYDSAGALVSKAETGYWSRDGMVLISSVKILADGHLVMQGERHCVEFDPASGEFENVRTGDHLEISIGLAQSELSLEGVMPVLQRVFITSREKLVDIVPAYWTNCLRQRVNRPGKDGLWECEAADKAKVPDIDGKQIEWDMPLPDTSLHDGTILYSLQHRVAYLREEGVSLPRMQVSPDPLFQWEQRRVRLAQLSCVLSVVIGDDGKASDIYIVTPVGMGLDDDAVAVLLQWRFAPGKRDGKPVPVRARVIFIVTAPNTRPTLPLGLYR